MGEEAEEAEEYQKRLSNNARKGFQVSSPSPVFGRGGQGVRAKMKRVNR
jgi:hypothetical protein